MKLWKFLPIILGISLSYAQLDCMELKQAKIDKTFRIEFLKQTIYFPIGQKFVYGVNETLDAIDFPQIKNNGHRKCFTTQISSKETDERKRYAVPFVCYRDINNELFCYLVTDDVPKLRKTMSLWGSATVVKTDNKSYMLVVSCNSRKYASWVLLHRKEKITESFRDEILDYIQTLGFKEYEAFSDNNSQNLSFVSMRLEEKCKSM